MSNFQSQSCSACRADSLPVRDEELKDFLGQHKDWSVESKDSVPILQRSFGFKDFQSALDFTVKVGHLAEEHQHHPEIRLSWGEVRVRWWTHKISALHLNDLIMAAKTEALL